MYRDLTLYNNIILPVNVNDTTVEIELTRVGHKLPEIGNIYSTWKFNEKTDSFEFIGDDFAYGDGWMFSNYDESEFYGESMAVLNLSNFLLDSLKLLDV